jgi:magnesium chelatase subunit I
VVPRISDVYAAIPAITGKLELEYEGEIKGADAVVHEIIRTAVAKSFDSYFQGVNMQQVVEWFDLGGSIQVQDSTPAVEVLEEIRGIQGLLDKLETLGISSKDARELQVSGAEFVLEGLWAHKRIGRTEERVFSAGEKPARRPEGRTGEEPPLRSRRPYN